MLASPELDRVPFTWIRVESCRRRSHRVGAVVVVPALIAARLALHKRAMHEAMMRGGGRNVERGRAETLLAEPMAAEAETANPLDQLEAILAEALPR